MINKGLGTFETLRITEANELFYVGAGVITNSLGVYSLAELISLTKRDSVVPYFI